MNFFISNSRLTILITLAFIILGTKGIFSLKRESIPPVDFAKVIISTVYPGSSSVEVEELITNKIEDEIRSIDHLKDINSHSQPGFSSINIRINMNNVDTLKVVNELHQSLQNVQGLPPEVLDPPRLKHLKAHKTKPVITLHVSGPDNNRLRDKITFDLKTNIEKLPDVSEVTMNNYKKREFLVLLSPEKMDKYYISSRDVIAALNQKQSDVPAGYLESPEKRTLVHVLSKSRTTKDIENTVIRSNFSGKKILIKDIAKVEDSFEKENTKEYFYQSENSKSYKLIPDTSLTIMKTADADNIKLASSIKKIIKEFKKKLNSEYKILVGFDTGDETKRSLINVINNALVGLLLIFVVFFLLLPFRIGFMASWSLPLSVLGIFSILPFIGVSFNTITMLAFVICIGMLVDNSVVITEYYCRLVMNKNTPPALAALQAVRQFGAPVTATVLTTVVAFLPMLVTTGVMGQFIKWIPIVVTLALLMSLLESFCLLPNRLQWFGPKEPGRYQQGILKYFNKLEQSFERVVTKIVLKKYLSVGGIASLIIITGIVFKFGNKLDLFPPRSPQYYTASIEPDPNTPLSLIDKKSGQIANDMQSILGSSKNIEWMSLKIKPEKAEILLKLKSSVVRKLKYKELLNKLRNDIDKSDLKNLRFGVLAKGPPVGKALQVAFQSNNRREIRNFIQEISPKVRKIKGVLDVKSNPDTNIGEEYKVQAQNETLARLGLSSRDVGLALRTALEGHLITELSENNESFYIRVKYEEKLISSLEALKKVTLKEPLGRLIPLGEVANFLKAPAETYRKSYNFMPVVFLEADIDSKKTTSLKVNAKVQKIIEDKIKNYPSLNFRMIGEQETTNESFQSLVNAGIIAIFAIFIILIILFKSFLISFLILTCIPLGLIGVIWAFFIHQKPISFFALIGVVGLAGVVVNSAIILVSFILSLKKQDPKKSLPEIVIQASVMRFKPIMITNLTTLGGLFPTAYGLAGFEPLLIPMTLALFWGLLTATFLTLIWIPCAILMIEDGRRYLLSRFSIF